MARFLTESGKDKKKKGDNRIPLYSLTWAKRFEGIRLCIRSHQARDVNERRGSAGGGKRIKSN